MRTHTFDAVSFIAGLAFSLIGLAFLIPETPEEIIDLLLNSGSWFWPIALLVVGIAVIVPVLMPKRDEDAIEASETD